MRTLSNILFIDGTCSFLYTKKRYEVEGFFLECIDRCIQSLSEKGVLVDEIVVAISLMDCLNNYMGETSTIAVSMIKAGMATRMEALF